MAREKKSGYDYVIVGAGSAGCVLAARLSEDSGAQVLLIEAGGKDKGLSVKIPAAFGQLFHTKQDWDYYGAPEPSLGGRSLYMPRGKMLGGTSSMNAMLYVRTRPLDHQLWAEAGADGWTWDEALSYYKKSENNERGMSPYHGVGGPLNVADERSPRKLTERFMRSCEEAGIPFTADYNTGVQDGVSLAQVTQKNGRRWSTASAFLRPVASRPNLTVLTGAMVCSVAIEHGRATGVRIKRHGRSQTISGGEIILSAGTFGSPQLLQLSGVGPADHLRAVGVAPVVDSPNVGQGLQDHPVLTCAWTSTVPESLYGGDSPRRLVEWMARGTGPLTSTAAEAFAFVRSRPGLDAPDLQYHFAPVYFYRHGAEELEDHAFTLAPVLVAPKSRGSLKIRSTEPTTPPDIVSGALTEQEDMEAMVTGVELARELAVNGPLGEACGPELHPGVATRDGAALEQWIRDQVELLYHPTGTVAMGSGNAPLDPQLRVRGVDRLRVVDASVFPVIPGGNTNAPTIMVAERAADIIRGRVAERAAAAAVRPVEPVS